jgi:GTP-binding protein HflX
MIEGNISGIRDNALNELEGLFKVKSYGFADDTIVETVARISARYNREIAVCISRSGQVTAISVGGHATVGIPVSAGKRKSGLSGVRTFHTHPGGDPELSEQDLSALKSAAFDVMAAVGIDGEGNVTGARAAYITPRGIEIFDFRDLSDDNILSKFTEFEAGLKAAAANTTATAQGGERALLCGITEGEYYARHSIAELKELAQTAGATVVEAVLQSKSKPDPRYYLGKGKIQEIAELVQIREASLVIVDNPLSGIQLKNLEQAWGVKVIDRSMLILDIFAGRAISQEGKLQVELAQLKYNLPRLIGVGGQMDKMRSGIGMRGPGEKKLETDRRIIREQVRDLEQKIKKLEAERGQRRQKRVQNCKSAAIVGYTNAGKSTLLNVLSKSDVLAENKLFATLDPIVRKVFVDGKRYFLLTDTVGFIHKLPHEFIDAFKSTLEEAKYADILIHVMDASNPSLRTHYDVVCDVLAKVGAGDKPMITVYNKMDAVADEPDYPVSADSIRISLKTGQNVAELKQMIVKKLNF